MNCYDKISNKVLVCNCKLTNGNVKVAIIEQQESHIPLKFLVPIHNRILIFTYLLRSMHLYLQHSIAIRIHYMMIISNLQEYVSI